MSPNFILVLSIACYFLFFPVFRWIFRRTIESHVRRRVVHVNHVLDILGEHDPFWDRERLEHQARSLFMEINEAWVKKDVERLEVIVGPRILEFMKRRIVKMNRKEIRNIMDDMVIETLGIVDFFAMKGNDGSHFTVNFQVSVNDYYLDSMGRRITRFGSHPWHDPNVVPRKHLFEFWTFKYTEQGWVVDKGEAGWGYGLNYFGSRFFIGDRELRWKVEKDLG